MPVSVFGQGEPEEPTFEIGAYLDVFYGYDFNEPTTEGRLPYLFHHNRHNQVSLNHGVIALRVNHSRFRSNLGFHSGTYVNDNYSSEPEILKAVYDANVGVALNSSRTLWLDAGIFGGSPIGFESTQIYGNDALSHNLVSENVPYFIAGARLEWQANESLYVALLMVNGWQRIRRVQGSSFPNLISQVTYTFPNQLLLNWSAFVGTDDPDATRRMRYFNNFYTTFPLGDRWNVKAGFDIGIQQDAKGSSSYNDWWGWAFIVRYQMNSQWAFAGRLEQYNDPSQIIVSSLDPTVGFKTSGWSLTGEYRIWDQVLTRIEARHLISGDDIYPKGGALSSDNFFLVAAIVVDLWKEL